MNETLQLEIIAVIEALNRFKESPDFELCRLNDQKPAVLDELAAERAKLLNQESVELEKRAADLAREIAELSGDGAAAHYLSCDKIPPTASRRGIAYL